MTMDQRRRLYTPPPGREAFTFEWLETCSIPQSMQFMMDCLPTMQKLAGDWPTNEPITVLDVGASSAGGTQLLATMFRGDFYGRPMIVDALDTAHEFQDYARAVFPDLHDYIVSDIFALDADRKWDIVISSHTIEHIADPRPFIEELRRRARRWVVLYAPFEEGEPLLPDHEYSLTREFVESFDPASAEVIRSIGWRKPGEPDSRCVLFVLHGCENVKPFRAKVESLWSAGEFARAVDLMETVVKRHPQHGEAYYCLAYSLAGAGRGEEAIGCYTRALATGFDEFWVIYHRGLVYADCAKKESAVRDLERALELRPGDAKVAASLKRAQTMRTPLRLPRFVRRLLAH
jgi:tetratricopeptide (TPR) repeat protein